MALQIDLYIIMTSTQKSIIFNFKDVDNNVNLFILTGKIPVKVFKFLIFRLAPHVVLS